MLATLTLAALMATAAPAPTLSSTTPLTCGTASASPPPALPLPGVVTGKVRFYAALYGPDVEPLRAVSLGAVNEVLPLASIYKPLVVWGALRRVDAGALRLDTRLPTTAANRSIEAYSPGANSVVHLARAAIRTSENTASDVLHREVGPARLARLVYDLSPCTQVLLPTKTFWAAQAGLLPTLMPGGAALTAGATAYRDLPFERRVLRAEELAGASLKVNADELLRELDRYFQGPHVLPAHDTALQNTSTAEAFTHLMARVTRPGSLSASSAQVLRGVMAQGCCRPARPSFPVVTWAAKAGSGWRLLTLTGVVDLPDGRVMAYTYINHESATRHAEDMERQIGPVVAWIDRTLAALRR